MLNIKLKYSFVETPGKFIIIAKLSIRKLGSSSGVIIIIISDRLKKVFIFLLCYAIKPHQCFQHASSILRNLFYFYVHGLVLKIIRNANILLW